MANRRGNKAKGREFSLLFAGFISNVTVNARPQTREELKDLYVLFRSIVAPKVTVKPCSPSNVINVLKETRMIWVKKAEVIYYNTLLSNIYFEMGQHIVVAEELAQFVKKQGHVLPNFQEAFCTYAGCSNLQIPIIATMKEHSISVSLKESVSVNIIGFNSNISLSRSSSTTVVFSVFSKGQSCLRFVVEGGAVNGEVERQLVNLRLYPESQVDEVYDFVAAVAYTPKVIPVKEKGEIIHTDAPKEAKETKFVKRLERYSKPRDETLDDLYESYKEVPLTPSNYRKKFQTALWLEELKMDEDILNFSLQEVELEPNGTFLCLQVDGLAEKRPSILVYDKINVMFSETSGRARKQYEGYVYDIQMEKIFVKFSPSFHNKYVKGMKVDVEFTYSRTCLRRAHQGIELLHKRKNYNFYKFPTFQNCNADSHNEKSVVLSQKLSEILNDRQKLAMKGVVTRSHGDAPFVIFGPPGTGKTTTLIQSIIAYTEAHPNAKILVMAPSNNATDVLVYRLSSKFPPSQMLRVSALSRSSDSFSYPEIVLKYCKRNNVGHFEVPPVDELKKYTVIVSTCYSALLPYSFGLASDGQDPYFSAIFVDEAGHCTEPEAWSGIACYLGSNIDKTPQLVLAGDPLQLGPILRSIKAKKLGLEISYLERLLNTSPLYENANELEHADARFVVKLNNNYRSHPTILDFPSKEFYNDELVSKADLSATGQFLKWDGLPTKGFPVVFHGVKGTDEREANSPSWFNVEEILKVGDYVEMIKNMKGTGKLSIGVITPYRRQAEKLKKLIAKLSKKDFKNTAFYNNIQIGTVDQFQGQEKHIIIISTVRAKKEHVEFDKKHNLGFIYDSKRFNVAITRPKSLLIVIGDPDVLVLDRHWRAFLRFVKDGGGSTGFPITIKKKSEILAEEGAEASNEDEENSEEYEYDTDSLIDDPEWQLDF